MAPVAQTLDAWLRSAVPSIVALGFVYGGHPAAAEHADDPVAAAFATVDALDLDPGAKEHAVAIGWHGFHHLQRRQPLAQVAHAAIDLGELLLALRWESLRRP